MMLLFLIISIFPVYFNRAKPIIGNPFYLRRVLTNSPKGDIDERTIASMPISIKDKILNNYILKNSNYTLKKDLTKEHRKSVFKLQDSIGLFDFDKNTVFQKSRLDNYFTQNPVIQKNMDTLFGKITSDNMAKNSINRKPIFIDLKTEFDSYEYLLWVYAKAKFKEGYYIGNSNSLKYRTYSKNIIDPKFYNLEITDKNKNWTIKYKN
jgi:hypothetical protein